jgi:hypothetical protein
MLVYAVRQNKRGKMAGRKNYPRREPGRRGPPPVGIPLKRHRERGERGPARQSRAARPAEDHVISHLSARYEEAYVLQRAAENTWATSGQFGDPLFGVSGWIVAAPAEPFPPGFARLSTLASYGFRVVATPHLGRRGHITILLPDPVDAVAAEQFNQAFGRSL